MTQICGEMNEIDEAEQEHLYSALWYRLVW
jgi:hypothetical protein